LVGDACATDVSAAAPKLTVDTGGGGGGGGGGGAPSSGLPWHDAVPASLKVAPATGRKAKS
jgi:hypothetical protein